MSNSGGRLLENRVLILAPTVVDGEMSRSILEEAGAACHVVFGLPELCREIGNGCGTIVTTELALSHDDYPRFVAAIEDQPHWSDLPVIVLARGGADSALAARVLDELGNAVVLEQPVRVSTLVSAVRMALRARNRQYQIREHIDGRKRTEAALREADRRKDEFLAMLAHELRNPLSAIGGAVQVLKRSGGDTESVEWSHGVIGRQVRHLAHLIDDLLDVSRITRGKIHLKRRLIEAGPVVDHAVDSVRPLLAEREHELVVSYAGEPAPLLADPTRLEQILINLLTNAAKYTEPGGRITFSIAREDKFLAFRVRDTGVGIATEKIPEMFELFAQGDRSLARSEGGLGIGLTIVRALAEMHGGDVSATSDGPGTGSEFVVRLPIAGFSAAAGSSPTGADSSETQTKGLRVLVIDDNLDTARAVTRILRLSGHTVESAHDGASGIDAALAFRPDVVLLDIGLPGMDGYEVAERLRSLEPTRDAYVVAISGYGQDGDRRRSREAGFDHHMVKPIDYDKLVALMRSRL